MEQLIDEAIRRKEAGEQRWDQALRKIYRRTRAHAIEIGVALVAAYLLGLVVVGLYANACFVTRPALSEAFAAPPGEPAPAQLPAFRHVFGRREFVTRPQVDEPPPPRARMSSSSSPTTLAGPTSRALAATSTRRPRSTGSRATG